MRPAIRLRFPTPVLAVAALIAPLVVLQAIGPNLTDSAKAQPAAAAARLSLPPGTDFTTLNVSCQTCHSLQMVLQQRLPQKSWTAEISKMAHWGAVITPRQQKSLAGYLARYLGPTAPPQPAALVPAPASQGAAAAHAGTASRFMSADARAHRVNLTIIAAYTSALGGFNFNGDGNGKMVIGVPVGWTVSVTFSNKSAVPHSALFTPFAQRQRAGNFALAFPGAASAHATAGVALGKPQHFHFVAKSIGTYALVCAVPGHEQAGMWDILLVTAGGNPRIML